MKKFFPAVIFTFAMCCTFAAETKIYFDRFDFPLVRTHWLAVQPHAEAWKQEWQIPVTGVRWRIRYNGDKSGFKTLTVINSKGKQIFHDNGCKKSTWINLTGADTYTLKAEGNPHQKLLYFVLDTYDNENPQAPAWRSTLMPSWRFLRVKTAKAPEGGALITPISHAPAIYTLLSNLDKKYRAEFSVVSAVPQTVTLKISWKKKAGKGRDRLTQTLAVTPGKPATVSLEFLPTTTPVDITLQIEKELTVKSFNLFEVK